MGTFLKDGFKADFILAGNKKLNRPKPSILPVIGKLEKVLKQGFYALKRNWKRHTFLVILNWPSYDPDRNEHLDQKDLQRT